MHQSVSEYFYDPNDPERTEVGYFHQTKPDKKSELQDIVFNDNNKLRMGYNLAFLNGKKVASFGISKWGDVEEDPKDILKLPKKTSFSNSIFFWGGFVVQNDDKQKGIGKSIIKKIFEDANVDNIFLYAAGYQEAVPFWMKIGGEVMYKQEDDDGIYYIRLERNKVLSHTRMLKEIVADEFNSISEGMNTGIIEITNETFYHQTNAANAGSILKNGFTTHMHDGQARYTHGVYFLKHPQGSYGNTTLVTTITGSFVDLTDDPFGDEWISLRDSVEWGNHTDLTVKLREKFPTADGIVFANRYLLVVWYPERCVKNIEIL